MKQFMMLCVCIALLGSSVGCCWMHPYGGGGYGGGACGTPNYYGGGGGYQAGAYSGGTSLSAGIPTASPYAYSQPYATTAGVPINSLPTY